MRRFVKKILITGANSFLGTSVENYLKKQSGEFIIDTVDMLDPTWRDRSFSGYDTVFHVAGLAHSDTKEIGEEQKKLYRAINTDLAIETAKKAHDDGAAQFIFMSSAIIYGDSAPIDKTKMITKQTEPAPANIYGRSKLDAETGIRKLAADGFKVVIIRSPMIYGSGCKGNYVLLKKIADKFHLFPDVHYSRSMLYVGNFVEFIRLMIVNGEDGIFFPQNGEYSDTAEMVRSIAALHGKKILPVKGFKWLLRLGAHFTRTINKAFGNLTYDMSISEYKENYRLFTLDESLRDMEKAEQ